MIKTGILVWLIVLLNTAPVLADLIQTTRGEFHNGIVQLSSFHLKTSYGVLEIPKSAIHTITPHEDYDVLVTWNGEKAKGKITETSVATTRELGPILDVSFTDISFIEFSAAAQTHEISGMDLIESRNGSVFLIKPFTPEIRLETVSGLSVFGRDQLKAMDVSFSEDQENHMARLMTQGGTFEKGILTNQQLDVQDIYGNSFSFPADEISLLVFDVMPQDHMSGNLLFARIHQTDDEVKTLQDRFVEGTYGPEMVIIPAGTYERGQKAGDFDELPLQTVTISKPFALSRYEITFEEYDEYCRATNCTKPEDSSWGQGNRPVINVSWKEAQAYIAWLSEKTGARYRLPTDAEWEYAARAGASTRFYWGDDVGEEQSNCAGCQIIWGSERTARVGRFKPNGFGLFDMAGNVFEWTQDCWNNTYENIGLNGEAYENPTGCGKRVIRGGGWSFPPKEIRSANRWRDFPTRRSDDTGFRVVRELN